MEPANSGLEPSGVGVAEQGQNEFLEQNNPLLFDMVLRSLFSLVDYDTLKNCRLVKRKWKMFSDEEFVLKSALVFDDENNGFMSSIMESQPADIQTLFVSVNLEYIRFSAFEFRMEHLTPRIREICIEPQMGIMRELEICSSSEFEVNCDEIIGPNINKLMLDSKGSQWSVSLKKLSTILRIDLELCKIHVTPDVKIKPVELKFAECKFEVGNENINVSHMGDFVEFGSVNKLELFGHILISSREREVDLKLNLSDCTAIEDISLSRITINLDAKIAPEKLTLNMNKYEVDGFSTFNVVLNDYLISTQMKQIFLLDPKIIFNFDNSIEIDELHLKGNVQMRGRQSEGKVKKLIFTTDFTQDDVIHLDLSLFPCSLKYLEVNDYRTNPNTNYIVTSGSLNLPNLKNLILEGCVNLLPYFKQCPSLVCVFLDDIDKSDKDFYLDLLPPNITSLSLERIFQRKFVGNRHINLKTLVLAVRTNPDVISSYENQMSRYLITDVLVLRILENGGPWSSPEVQERVIQKILAAQQKMKIKTLALGTLRWVYKGKNFPNIYENSVLFPIVDKRAKNYLFEDKGQGFRGKAISSNEFTKIITLD